MEKISIFGVNINIITNANVLHYCHNILTFKQNNPKIIFTPNPEILVHTVKHPDYIMVLNQADINIPDGQGIIWASKGIIKERVTGTDLLEALLKYANIKKLSVGFIINESGLTTKEQLATVITTNYPNCEFEINYSHLQKKNHDIIFVALGAPQQEKWIIDNKTNYIDTKLMIAVGGGIDFLTKQQKRAPLFLQKTGLEWLWRLINQPKRWKRIITAVIVFPYYVLTKPS